MIAVLCCVWPRWAAAEGRLALLPLDAPGKLAIYGQPVAGEVARALRAAGLDVVVVGAQMAVPQEAELVVEGSLAQTRKRITVELRLRALDSRIAIATAAATEPLSSLDRAAMTAAQRLLPKLQEELRDRARAAAAAAEAARLREPEPAPKAPPPRAEDPRPLALISVTVPGASVEDRAQFSADVAAASAELVGARWRPRAVELPEATPVAIQAAIAATPGALGVAIDVSALAVNRPSVFVGSVRARAIVTFAGEVLFDRTLVSDTIVGGRKATRASMLKLVARELVAILRPRFARAVAASAVVTHAAR